MEIVKLVLVGTLIGFLTYGLNKAFWGLLVFKKSFFQGGSEFKKN